MERLNLITNESVSKNDEGYFCDNIDIKTLTEGLNNFYDTHLFCRASKNLRSFKIINKNIVCKKSFLGTGAAIFNSLKIKNSKYLIVSITPYTFLTFLILRLFKKKIFLYLRSDGFDEYKLIIGNIGQFLYGLMFRLMTKQCSLISVTKKILKNNPGHIVTPSNMSKKWCNEKKEISPSNIKLLYVGRLKIEKGIFSLDKLLVNLNKDYPLTIVCAEKNENHKLLYKNINFLPKQNEESLIEIYDKHNIFILPSFTEGRSQVMDEALSRSRPVIIFNDIEHMIANRKGIIVSKRDSESLEKSIQFIQENYINIQNQMKENKFTDKTEFIESIKNFMS